MEQLIYGKLAAGGYYVRPASWAGEWKGNVFEKDSELTGGKILYKGITEEDCIGFIKNEKLKVLNEIEVDDYDADSGGIIYIVIENTEENREILKSLGATEESIQAMAENDEDYLDISEFAFTELDAEYYTDGKGFIRSKYISMPDGKGGEWHITEEDCIFKCEECGTEKKVKLGYDPKYIPKEMCCNKQMAFRWWVDRSDIYHEE